MPAYEIYLFNDKVDSITVTDTAYGQVWDKDLYLTDNLYQSGQVKVEGDYTYEDDGGSGNYGFFFAYDGLLGGITGKYDTLGFGFYKISTTIITPAPPDTTDHYFYLDLRDSTVNPIDIDLRFENTNNWSWMHHQPCDGVTPSWTGITDGDTFGIWEWWEDCANAYWTNDSPCKKHFQPTNASGLNVVDSAGHPKLTWTASTLPDSQITYEVYRKSVTYYSEIKDSITSTRWIDTAVDIDKSNPTHYYYKIRAVSGDDVRRSPGYSNIDDIWGAGPIEKRVIDQNDEPVPSIFSLSVYPNPFNPTVFVQYEIPDDSEISLAIVNLGGRKIRTVDPRNMQPGVQTLIWDATNDAGDRVPSGTYFLILKAGEDRFVKKLLYLK